ncbi:hypothetical protein WJX73_009505 [Symbiochloris irregularis]|uniref:Fe2OG dioxygenase domain-containing protein n=1 Tax=Symbiochloris irregularis TaxID=706552 RepID=A0AAW1PVS3_9CHLO
MGRKILKISLHDFEARKHEVGKQVVEACRDTGFFLLSDHGVPDADIDEAFAQAKRALDLPGKTKKKYPFSLDRYVGWRGLDELSSVTGNRLWEQWLVNRYGVGGYDARENDFIGDIWPQELGDSYKDFVISFQEKTHAVLLKLLRAIALGLGWEEHFFDEAFDITSEQNPSILAVNYYPPLTEEEVKQKQPPRLHGHADMDMLTILYQRPGDTGLEIAPGNDAQNAEHLIADPGNIWNSMPDVHEWTPLDPVKGCVTVNIGDGLARWTDGLLKSTYHRVRAPRADDNRGPRYSIPYFANSKLDVVIQGPNKKFDPVTSFDLLSKTGESYDGKKNKPGNEWQKKAYLQAYDREVAAEIVTVA